MRKRFGACSLVLINGSLLYLVYWYLYIICSTKPGNILHIPYEPSGMQYFFYFISFPLFLIVALVSQLHSYYFELKNSLFYAAGVIWCSYFILIISVDRFVTISVGKDFIYYSSWTISVAAIIYVIYSSYCQFVQLINMQ